MITPQRNSVLGAFFFGAIFLFVASLFFVRPYHPDLNAPAPEVQAAPVQQQEPQTVEVVATKPVTPVTTAVKPPVKTAPRAALQSPEVTISHWLAAQNNVGQALAVMKQATFDNKGGYAEKAIADLETAVKDLDAAVDYVQRHPEALPIVVTPHLISVGSGFQTYGAGTSSPNLRRCLVFLKSALDELQMTPEDAGGFHAKVIADIVQAGSNTILGLKYSEGARNAALVLPY